ncbi:MAG: mechanosensitive ion channel domain-containing protein, partial [Pseudomonadota bacterium]
MQGAPPGLITRILRLLAPHRLCMRHLSIRPLRLRRGGINPLKCDAVTTVCVGLALVCSAVHAQTPSLLAVPTKETHAPAPEIQDPAPRDVQELARLLSDPNMAAWLRKRADESATQSDATSSDGPMNPQEWLSARLERFKSRAARLVDLRTKASDDAMTFTESWQQRMGEGETLRSFVYCLVFLLIGAGVEWLYWRYAWNAKRRIERSAQRAPQQNRLRGTTLRALLTLLGITLFSLATLGAFLAFSWDGWVEIFVVSLLLLVIGIRLIKTVITFVLCPFVPELRPINASTWASRFWYRWLLWLTSIALGGFLMTKALLQLDVAPSLALLIGIVASAVVALVAIGATWRWYFVARRERARANLHCALRSSHFVPTAVTAVILLAWIAWTAGATAISLTLLIALLVALGDRVIRSLVPVTVAETLNQPTRDNEDDEPDDTDQETTDDDPNDTIVVNRHGVYGPVVARFLRFLLVLTAVVMLSASWGYSLWSLSESSSTLGRWGLAFVDVLVAFLIADLIWVWARTAIDIKLAESAPREAVRGEEGGGAAESRLGTLLPLLRKILFVTLVVMVILIALSSLGVNIGPLIAGAGVVGLAIGFGAQALVRDIVSGIFFLLDDAFRTGEYIEVGDLRGTVEAISIRSLRLRHHRGAVHTIPFGEMKSLTNHSRDWVIMKL